MATLEEIKQMIKSNPEWDTFGTKKEVKELPSILTDGENIIGLTSGFLNGNTWLIVVTPKRLLFLDKGMIFGLKQVEILVEKINSIEFKTGLLLGEIHVWDGSSKMVIKNIQKASVKPFAESINKAIDLYRSRSQSGGSASFNIANELKKLADLKTQGILTEAEFDAQKKKLLAT